MSLYDNIRHVTPYVPGEQPAGKVVKLNTNECPYAPSPRVAEAIAACDAGRLRLYPEPDCHTLKEAIAAHYAVKPDEVFIGVGSDDVLALAFLTFFAGQKPVLFPDITYSFYDVWAELYAIPYETVPLAADFTLRPEDYARQNGGVIFANPNAPTGLALPLSGVEEILAKNPESVVIVDEAYIDFGAETALPLLKKYENLVVVRTMSKSRALAGMRIGYAFASKRLIRALEDVKASINSYTMTTLSLSAGKAAIEDEAYFQETLEKIIKTREETKASLQKLGFSVTESKTNFLFARNPDIPAQTLFEGLRKRGIYVRYFKKPRIDEHLRITIGTDEDMKQLLEELRRLSKG